MVVLKIIQVLNNNVLLVEDGNDKQQIIWGKGIGFSAKQNEDYMPKEEDHIFLPVSRDDNQWIDPFMELAGEIPREYFELTDEIVNLAQKTMKAEFDGHLLVPLTDHIYFAVERVKNGVNLTTPMLFDIQRYFPKEFQIGKQALVMIGNLANVEFTDDEAGFIAMHLIEHELTTSDSSVQSVEECLQILDGVNDILEKDFGKDFLKDSVAASRMATHLYYLLLRMKSSSRSNSSDVDDAGLLNKLKRLYPKPGKSFEKIVKYIEKTVDYKLDDSDRLFLLIHIIHIIE